MTSTATKTRTAADFEMGDHVMSGKVEGSICGIFPAQDEVEIYAWIPEPYTCFDGSHVAGCSGTVEHRHAGYYSREVFPAAKVRHMAVEVY